MTDTKPFATPAEAVACLRECLDVWSPDITVRERAALESLEAEVGRLTEALALVTAPPDPPTEPVFRFARRSALNRIRTHNECTELGALARWALTLESELAEKKAIIALASKAKAAAGSTPVALDRGEAVAGELAAAIREVEVQCDDMSDAVALVAAAARNWAALQWREPSTDHAGDRLLLARRNDDGSVTYGIFQDWVQHVVEHWDFALPLDALPALPSEPVKP